MFHNDFGNCVHGCNTLICTHPACKQANESRIRLIHMSNAVVETACKYTRRRKPPPKTTSLKNARKAICVHFPEGAAHCKHCRVKAREEVLKIMLEENGDQHLCPFLYE